MPSEARRQAANVSPEPLTDEQWQQKANRLAALMREVTGDASLCGLFQLTPGGVMGVMANHSRKHQDLGYRQLKTFLLGIQGMTREALVTGHCPEGAYDELNHLCQWVKSREERWENIKD